MKTIQKTVTSIFAVLCLLLPLQSWAQWSNPATVGSHPELILLYSYQWVTAGRGHQDLKIICKNIKTDKIEFKITYDVHFHNGEVEKVASENIIRLGAGETFDPSSITDWGGVYKRFFLTPSGGKYGAKEKWFKFGKDNYDTPLYSAISSVMNMKITDFVNLSQKERGEKKLKEDEAKKKEIADKKKKEEEQNKKQAEAKNKEENNKQSATQNIANNTNDDFWSDKTSDKKTTVKTSTLAADENFISESKFSGGLSKVKEGEFFTNDKGEYFQKKGNGAQRVDKTTFDKDEADRIYAHYNKQEDDRKERIESYNKLTEQVTTNFYLAQTSNAAHRNMTNAANLSGNFQNMEQLNAEFSQKMSELKRNAQEMKSSSLAAMNNYTSSVASRATTSSDQAYAGALGALGAMASTIAANNEARKAREELERQKTEYEKEIRESQRKNLVEIRNQIDQSFKEGGMPLSHHKIEAPVLYLFAYTIDKKNWDKDANVPVIVTNVIPVYRYNDGTYPYLSNVKKTFETAISNPKVIGYFTDKSQAESYRNTLLDIGSDAKFALQTVDIKVKEELTTSSVNQDFWGNKKSDTSEKNNEPQSEVDFWGKPVKSSKTAPDQKEVKKKDNFWGN